MRRWLPELAALSLLPCLMLQGRRVRRLIPRLPEAEGGTHGMCGIQHGGEALRLIGIGESTVAGVGVTHQDEAITAQLAACLSQQFQRMVRWTAYGRNGATLEQGLERILPVIPDGRADIVLIAFGVNDTTDFLSSNRWRSQLQALLCTVDHRLQPATILLSGVPPMGRFPALPPPLRTVLGLKASALDREAVRLSGVYPHVRHVPLPSSIMQPHLMASDGFHPSAEGCVEWARRLASCCPMP